jgi:hypothetical protein
VLERVESEKRNLKVRRGLEGEIKRRKIKGNKTMENNVL